MMDLSKMRRALWLAPVAFTFTACDGTAPRVSQPLTLSVTTKGTSGVPVPAGSGMSAAIQIGSGANSLTITQAQGGPPRTGPRPAATGPPPAEADAVADLQLGPPPAAYPAAPPAQGSLVVVA